MKSIVIRMAVATALCAGSVGAFAATEWLFTGVTSTDPQVTGFKTSASNNTSTIFGTGVTYYGSSGFGVNSAEGSPQHALDNESGFEVALLSFGQQVNLERVKVGWTETGKDSDFFVMAFTGTGDAALGGKQFASLGTAGSGWTLVGNYAGSGTGVKELGTAFANTYSNFWLIGAGGFTSGVGVNSGDIKNGSAMAFGSCSGSGSSKVCGNYDYLKIASVDGTIKPNNGGGSVPEPGSLALAGLAFMGMVGMRRRKQAA